MTTYEELLTQFGHCEGMLGANIDGEYVIVTIDEKSAEVKTFQENGWMRINTYYPDGTQDEAYRK